MLCFFCDKKASESFQAAQHPIADRISELTVLTAYSFWNHRFHCPNVICASKLSQLPFAEQIKMIHSKKRRETLFVLVFVS